MGDVCEGADIMSRHCVDFSSDADTLRYLLDLCWSAFAAKARNLESHLWKNLSPARRAVRKKYLQTERGRESQRRASRKAIKNLSDAYVVDVINESRKIRIKPSKEIIDAYRQKLILQRITKTRPIPIRKGIS
jgi:hypothetical protein